MAGVSPTQELVSRIHAAPRQMVLAVTGGGSRAIADLLEVPGGSRTLLEAVVPYSAAALSEFLGGRPEEFCSARTARAMAMAAFQRARRLQGTADPSAATIGVGCTASLASDRPKRGAHRIHVAVQTAEATVTHSLELVKGRRDRANEEDVAATMLLNAVAEGMCIETRLTLAALDNEHVESTRTVAPQAWQDLLLGRIQAVRHPDSQSTAAARAVFPGAFNPLHEGHRRMAEVAARRLGAAVEFELSIENVEKPPLDYTEMQERMALFAEKSLPLWFTRAATFEEKSGLFPGATFLVGADTLVRIGQPKYYGDNPAAAEAAFANIARRGCRFLLFGRVLDEEFKTLADLALPDPLRKLCDEVPADEFRADVSSTELRQQSADE